MAFYGKEKKEHAFQTFQRDIKEDNITNLVLFCGSEDYLVNWAADMIVKKYVQPVTKSLDFDNINMETAQVDDITASCETAPILSEKKVVLIKNYDGSFVKEITEYTSDLPESTILIITCREADKKLAQNGRVYDFGPLHQKQLESFIAKRFKAAGKQAQRGMITTLINESGYMNKDIDYTLYNLDGDIKKIIALSEGDEITLNNIRAGISDNLEHGVFALMDAISSNKKDKAFDLLNQLLLSGVKEFNLLGSIISQFEIMLQTKELAEDGCQLGEIKRIIKVHEYRVRKSMDFVRKYSVKELKRILKNAYATDSKIKTGLLDSHLALEMLIAEI